MAFLKSLKDALVEPEVTPTVEPRAVPSRPAASVTGAVKSSPILDNDSLRMKTLEDSMAAKLFLDTLQSLSSYIPEEPSRFKAARDTSLRQGVTIPSVTDELESALRRLEGHRGAFETAKASKESAEITTKKDRLDEIDHTINALGAERVGLLAEVRSAREMIDRKKKLFYVVADALEAEYQGTLDKIKLYLKGAN